MLDWHPPKTVAWAARFLYAALVAAATAAGMYNVVTIFRVRGDYGAMLGTILFLLLPLILAGRILNGHARAIWTLPKILLGLAAVVIALPIAGMTPALQTGALLAGFAAFFSLLAIASRLRAD